MDEITREANHATSMSRFPDGAHFRVEIPSVEGPGVLEAVLETADRYSVRVNRVSQGSGAMLLLKSELQALADMGAAAGVEVCLFVGPRSGWDVSVAARSSDGAGESSQIRGFRQFASAIRDVERAAEQGIRSFLIPDLGLLRHLRQLQLDGALPLDCVWKASVSMAPSNPLTFSIIEELGATTINVPSDVSAGELADYRSQSQTPIDLYVESPDALGGVVRGNELPELIRVAAPLYAKFGLRNSRPLYPSGVHLEGEAKSIAREKVHRAAVALEWLADSGHSYVQSEPHALGLGVPERRSDLALRHE